MIAGFEKKMQSKRITTRSSHCQACLKINCHTLISAEESAMHSRISTLLLAAMACLTQQSAKAEGDGRCPIETAINQLPQIQYRVGSEVTVCRKEAAELRRVALILVFISPSMFNNACFGVTWSGVTVPGCGTTGTGACL